MDSSPSEATDINQHSDQDHRQNQPLSQWPLRDEPYRPKFHFTPNRMWMNDPNGLIYHDGVFHLFFQYHPDSMIWGPMHWGHATSKDLLNWEEHPIALFPDEHGTIFSGCCVNDQKNTSGLFKEEGPNNIVALYSYDTQTQGLAFSEDKGFSWNKFQTNPILPAMREDFRDPKVIWHEPSQHWVMVISAHRECHFYRSSNLIDWEFASSFSGGCVVGVWEVPDLFQLQAPDGQLHWVLLVSINDGAPAGGSGVQYFIGDFDGYRFKWNEENGIKWLDFGPDNYAGSTWYDAPKNEKLYVGWMSNWPYANKTPTDPWRGCMSLPRKLELFENDQELELGGFPFHLPKGEMLSEVTEIQNIQFFATDGFHQTVLLQIGGKETGHKISVDFKKKILEICRPVSNSSMFPSARLPLLDLPKQDFLLVYDNGIVEIFDKNSGRALSQLSFPQLSDP